MTSKNNEAEYKELFQIAENWFERKSWTPLEFQLETWKALLDGNHGLVNAPTGSGKTLSLLFGVLLDFIRDNPDWKQKPPRSVQLIWVAPIRALSKEILLACQRVINDLDLPWKISVRTGDTSSSQKTDQLKNPPQILITTPESLHILLANKAHLPLFKSLRAVVVDEWHELIGSKRGVQVELFLSRMKTLSPAMRIWGISATIGNLEEAMMVLCGLNIPPDKQKLVLAKIEKGIELTSLFPDHLDLFPWAGHLGLVMVPKLKPILESSNTILLFTNTRGQCEIWYQKLLEFYPDLAGIMAMHHGSISQEIREWVEEQLHQGKLKLVVCTSSLDLGVDFRPVDTIIQVGSPKSVSRIMQRAGRSGHKPGAKSRIFFVPTHALELVEVAALREAITDKLVESREPLLDCYDVLIQYLVTLSVSYGFIPKIIYEEILNTVCYQNLDTKTWNDILQFIQFGGKALSQYESYLKVQNKEGIYKIASQTIARKHRMNIGTITSTTSIEVKYPNGKKIGMVEEWFLSQLKIGDVFWLGGKSLELINIGMPEVLVRNSKEKTRKIPSWQGGRMPLSSSVSYKMRVQIDLFIKSKIQHPEISFISDLLIKQSDISRLPSIDELLIEYFQSDEGFHLLIYPFEGRFVHEGIGVLLANRIAKKTAISFSIAMNDYGVELFSDQEISPEDLIDASIFDTKNLYEDILSSMNMGELAKRKFRDIAQVAGLLPTNLPGKAKRSRHLQTSAQLLFEVFKSYDPDHILLQQAELEVLSQQLEESRLRAALHRMQKQKLLFEYPNQPSPFAFPILVDNLRERLSSEKVEDQIKRWIG
ncbi:MAG: ligase-associated DNA damage response DEXH box helicase [Bacteroidota bacterium]|nr:ligase-associated DNA damage response DEXH box helicase [Bacteroidota bacterium]